MVLTADDDVDDSSGWRGRGKQHSVDDVDHAIVGGDVCRSDRGVIDHDSAIHDGDGDVLAEHGGDHLPVRQVATHGGGVDHVVEEDVRQTIQGQQVIGRDVECSDQCSDGGIGRGEYGEGTISTQVVCEAGGNDGSLQEGVVFAVHHHVDDGRLGLNERPQQKQGQQKGMLEHGLELCDCVGGTDPPS